MTRKEIYNMIASAGLPVAYYQFLHDNDLFFDKTEVYIDDEKMFMITYTMEVLINV